MHDTRSEITYLRSNIKTGMKTYVKFKNLSRICISIKWRSAKKFMILSSMMLISIFKNMSECNFWKITPVVDIIGKHIWNCTESLTVVLSLGAGCKKGEWGPPVRNHPFHHTTNGQINISFWIADKN